MYLLLKAQFTDFVIPTVDWTDAVIAESCGLQPIQEKLFQSVASMLDTKYRDPFDSQLLGKFYL